MRVRHAAAVLGLGLLLVGSSAPAEGKEINWSLIRAVSRKGAFTFDLREKVSLRVPTGYRLVTEDKLTEYHELMGDTPAPEEVGVLLPERGGWVATITFPKEDPLKGADPKQLDADALMKWNERELDEARPKRTTLGLPVLKITGWTHKPAYDADTKRLTMGMRVTEDGERSGGKKDELYYKSVLYGPDGAFVCLQTMTTFGNWNEPVEESKKLAGEFNFGQAVAEADAPDNLYYVKIGGAGVIGVVVVLALTKLVAGRRPAPVQPRSTARRFGTPR